jgi:UDP-N-acetylglucosamine--N-acetylmuramyl-(pentapeptide) pyrophosphoryl-undecaprenol N-acetylglucosamine transferase
MADRAEVLWVGGEGGMEARLVERAGVPFKSIPAAGVHGVGIKTLPRNIARLVQGFIASRRILRSFQPDVLFFTGGYVAVPMALAGMRRPSLLYVPDIEPALALKTLAKFADRIAVTAKESFRYFNRPRKVVLTGYPTRSELAGWSRPEARQKLSLSAGSPVLLVTGGSKGARSINNALWKNLPAVLDLAQVVHLTGELDWPAVESNTRALTAPQASRYHPFPYLHEEMGAALAAADLVLSRAGASTLGEYPLFGLPAMLVPYPHAWRYQKVNAAALVDNGAAIMLEDSALTDQLLGALTGLLKDPDRLAAMRTAMQALAHPGAAAEIGQQIFALCQERS